MTQQTEPERSNEGWVGSLRGDFGLRAREEAYQALGTILQRQLYRFLLHRQSSVPGLWNKSHEELDELAQEFTQDTVEKLAREHLYNLFRGEAKFTTFMTRVAQNVVRTELRKGKWSVAVDSFSPQTEYNLENEGTLPSLMLEDTSQLSPEVRVILEALWRAIGHCVDGLPERWRQAFIDRELHKLSMEEAKRHLKTDSDQVIFNLVHRARKRLKQCLRENDWDLDGLSDLDELSDLFD